MRKPKFDTTTLPLAGLANRKAMAEDPPINGELDYLFHSFFHHLQRVLGKNKLALIVRDPGTAMYTIVANQGYRGDLGKTQFAEDSPLIRHFVTQPMPIHHSQMDTNSRGQRCYQSNSVEHGTVSDMECWCPCLPSMVFWVW